MRESDVVVIDEVGKMELLSPAFRDVLIEVLNSRKRLLGTIMLQPHPFADQIKRDARVRVVLLTRANRQVVFDQATEWLRT
jgi:nucleoside-triphosphatase